MQEYTKKTAKRKYRNAWKIWVHPEVCTSTEFCIQHTNGLDCNTSAQKKWDLKTIGTQKTETALYMHFTNYLAMLNQIYSFYIIPSSTELDIHFTQSYHLALLHHIPSAYYMALMNWTQHAKDMFDYSAKVNQGWNMKATYFCAREHDMILHRHCWHT